MSQKKTKQYIPKSVKVNSVPVDKERDGTLPIPETLEKVKGYKSLTIYKMMKSPYYYVRLFEERKVIRKCTKTNDRKEAIKFAERFFVEIKSKIMNKEPLSSKSGFEVCALGLQNENKSRVERGELSDKKFINDEYRLKKDILPFFSRYEVAEINYRLINEYIQKLNSNSKERKLSSSSLKVHLSHIKTILKFSQRMDVINTLPAFPSIKTVDKPRSWFNNAEYAKLHNTARTHIGEEFVIYSGKDNSVLRKGILTKELYDLILFMTNTFIRPTDIRVIKHKHIAIVKSEQVYLRLSHPITKGHSNPIVSLPSGIEIYESIRNRQLTEGYGKDEDFLFQPENLNRDYALQQLHRQFDYLLQITNLKNNPTGEARTLYSLRHTSIMFRLTESKGLDLLSLARNARTSVEMIDRFYAKHLTAEMNVELIQSNRSDGLTEVNAQIKKRVMGDSNIKVSKVSSVISPTKTTKATPKKSATKTTKTRTGTTRTSSKSVR